MSARDDFLRQFGGATQKRKKTPEEEFVEQMRGQGVSLTSSSGSKAFAFLQNDAIAPVIRPYASRDINVTTESARKYNAEEDEKKKEDDRDGKWFKGGAFSDGWQFGDLTKTVVGTLHDVNENITEAVVDATENLIDTTAYGVGAIGGIFNKDFQDDVGKFIAKEILQPKKVGEAVATYGNPTGWANLLVNGGDTESNSVLGDKADGIVQSGAHLAGSYALQMVGVPAWLTQGVNAFGSEIESAFQDDATFAEAGISGGISAAAEIAFERFSSGIKLGGSTLDEGAQTLLKTGVKNKLSRTIAKYVVDVLAEGGEEVATEAVSAVGRKLTYMKDEEFSDIFSSQDALDAFIGGAIMSGVAGGGKIVKSAKTGRDYVSGLTANEEAVVKKIYDEELAKRKANGERVNKTKLYDDIVKRMERGYIDTDTIESILGGDEYKAYKDYTDSNKALKAELDELRGMESGKRNDFQNERLEELKKMNLDDKTKSNELKKKLDDKVSPLVNGSRLVESYNERARANQDFVADYNKYKGTKHEDAAKQTLDNAIKAGANNTNRVHDIVDMAANLSAETGYVYVFKDGEMIKADFIERKTKEIAKLEAIENRTEAQNSTLAAAKKLLAQVQSGEVKVNGNIGANGQVVLNLDSDTPLNRIVGHEVTHSTESAKHYAKLKESLFAYAKTKGRDIKAELEMKALEYEGEKNADPEAELVADLVGEYLFTDSDYVKTLTTKNRNVAQWLFNEIKYLLTKVTTGSKEERELLRVKHEFEKAFREAGEVKTDNSGTVKNSISKNKITNKLTGEEIDQNTYRVLDRLNNGETVAADELANLKEVQEGKLRLNEMVQDFIAQNPQHSEKPKNQIGTHLLRTEERKQLRRQIIDERLAEGSFSGIDKDGNEEYNGSVKNGKRLDIVIGLPASGKSSGIVNPLSQFYQSAVIDSDIIKTKLPEYNDGIGASLVHTESIDMNGTLLKKTMALGRNAVLPTIGANPDNVAMYIEKAKGQGYEVHVHLCELSSEKATGRMLLRYLNKGRFISPTAIARYGNSPAEVYEQLKQRGDISGYSRWDNDVPEGQRPNQTEISGNNRAYGQFSEDWGATRSRISEGVVAGAERVNNEIAPTKETSSKDGVFFDAEAEEISDSKVQYSLRKSDPPKETGVAYKVFFVKDGKLYPPMVANPDGADTPMGVWLDADVGTAAPPSKTGRQQVKAGGKGTQGGSGSLAFRPGWHLGDLPRASQFDRLNPETGKKELFPENFVWAEVEYAKDVDYQEEAMSYGYTENGKFRHAYAGLPRLPENGYYRYRTNPKPDTVPWVITGAMKVNRLLSDADVNKILEENGVPAVHRQGGDVGLDKFGFNEDGTVKYSLSADSDGNQLSNEQRNYFKNSKAVDDNGNLLVMYHGSQNLGFTVFDPNASDDNKSFFFSDKPSVAASYSDSTDEIAPYAGEKSSGLYKTYLNLENPYVVDARGAKWNNVVEFAEGDEFLSDIGAYMGIIRNMDSSLTIEDFLDSVRGDLVGSTEYAIEELFIDEDTEESHFTAEEQQELRELAQRINDAYMEWDEDAHIDEDGESTDFESYVRQNYTMKTTRQIANEAYKKGYDGVIFKNIVDVGKFANGAQQNYDKSTVAVAFDSKQIKSVDNTSPTDDPDIRFSLSKPVEQTKNLVALHNLTADKLTKSLELGGLPMPSLAVTKADIPHDNFGDITLIFGEETVDPKASKKNKVYSADAWTPIFPNVEYEADSKVVNRVTQKLRDLGGLVDDHFQSDLSRVGYSIEDYLNRQGGEEGLIQYVMDNYGLKAAYLEDAGKHIDKVTKQEEVPRKFNPNSADKYEKIMDILGVTTAEEIWDINLKEARDTYGEEIDAVFPGATASALRMGKVLGMVGSYIQGKDSAPEYRTVTDSDATRKAVDDALDAEGFESWVRNLFSGVVKDSGIYNNKDIFTPSGNRRSFKQTHLPVTLENIVKAMASQNDGNAKNVSGFNGVKTLRAATAETFKSIDEMHQREGRLQHLTQEQADEITDALQSRLSNIIRDIDNANAQKGDSNPYIRYDQIGQVLTEIGEGGKYNVADIQSVFSEYGRPISDDVALDVKQLLYDVSQMPVNIFEAKPQRVVGFDEAKVFVIPRNADVKLKQELLNRGYSIAEYDPDVEGDRQRVVNNFEEYKFSLSNAGESVSPTPIGGFDVYGKDFRVQPTDDIAPTGTNVTEAPQVNVNTEDEPTDDIAPTFTVEAPKETTAKDVEAVLGNKDSFISKKAMALYEEVKGMKKGVRVSGDLSYILDTLDLSEENKVNSYKSLRTALLNIRDNPNQLVNPNSAVESTVREMITREYDSMVEDLAMPDGVTEKIFSKMKGIRTEVDNLTTAQEQSKADFDADIAELQAEYDAKKNKNTKVANDLLRRIESKKRMKDNVDADYARRISKLEGRLDKMSQPEYKTAMQRKNKQAEYTNLMKRLVGDTTTWVDKKLGISYKINTLRRNLRDVVRDANGNRDIAKADAIYDELQGKYNHNEAELKREAMRIKDPFVKLGLNNKESTYAMMLGEFRHNPDTKLTEAEVKEYYEKHKRKIDTKKVDQGIDEARKLFDELLPRINERLREQGMKEIPYRQGYFPHFENPKQSWLAKLFNWKTVDTEIPTSIAGITESFNPQKSYQSFDKHRKGDTTDYNLNQAIDSYAHGALDWIYHIEDIQKRRALENYIRYIHSDEGVQARIDEIQNSDVYDADEMQAQIDAVYAEAKNPLNNFVTDLRAGTNTLANKKSSMDRGMEEATNRKIYSVMTNLNNRINANMVVGSISSALTNFIPITQSWMEVSPLYTLRGMRDTIQSIIRDDGMVNKSDYLTNRLMNEENLNQTWWDKRSKNAAFMMEAIDNFASQTIWRSKYLQNLHEGMSEVEAMKNADQFAENVMAGRSRGNMPTIFDSKNPLVKIMTAFQLEVNNQYQYMFKDAPQDSKNNIRLAKGYATAFIGAYVYNALYSSLVGRDAAFDPISIIEDLFRDLFGEEEEEPEEIALNFVDNVLEEVPFVGGLAGGGRIPISSALPYDGDYKTLVTDLANGEASTKEWLKPVYYLVLPFGGGQLKKTNEGLAMFNTSEEHPVAGSYTDSGNLRFPVDDTLGNRVQAGLFGQYANKNAREYFDNDWAPLKEKQIQEFADLDIPIKDYREIREDLAELDTLGEKAVYINDLDLPISKKNLLINNIADRDEPIDLTGMSEYDDFGEFEYAKEYPTKHSFLEANGITYEKFENFDKDTKEAWNWAYENPGKRVAAKAVSVDIPEFRGYVKAINKIETDKDANGETIRGSGKEKKMAYIESLNVDYYTKLILHKMTFETDDFYNAEIVEYIIGRNDLTFDEKTALFEELGFKTSNGQVSWD